MKPNYCIQLKKEVPDANKWQNNGFGCASNLFLTDTYYVLQLSYIMPLAFFSMLNIAQIYNLLPSIYN